MKKEVTETKTEKHSYYYCDVCGEPTYKICKVCGRDICNKHSISDERQYGDYTDYCCKECWDIGKPYREQQEILQLECETETEKIEKQWYDLCKLHHISNKKHICP